MSIEYRVQVNFPEESEIWKTYYPIPSTLEKAEQAFTKVCKEDSELGVRLISIIGESNIPYEVLKYRKGRVR